MEIRMPESPGQEFSSLEGLRRFPEAIGACDFAIQGKCLACGEELSSVVCKYNSRPRMLCIVSLLLEVYVEYRILKADEFAVESCSICNCEIVKGKVSESI